MSDTERFDRLLTRVEAAEVKLEETDVQNQALREHLTEDITTIKDSLSNIKEDVETLFKKSDKRSTEIMNLKESIEGRLLLLSNSMTAIETVLSGYQGQGGLIPRFNTLEKKVMMGMGAIGIITIGVPVIMKLLGI